MLEQAALLRRDCTDDGSSLHGYIVRLGSLYVHVHVLLASNRAPNHWLRIAWLHVHAHVYMYL